MGFPIRKSADQSFFAAPRGLSQRSTSFIASQRQGIHRMPLGHLIALIINAHPARQRSRSSVHANGSIGRTLNRKTSLLRIVPTACGQAADKASTIRPRCAGDFHSPGNAVADARRLRIDRDVASRSVLGAILPLHDVRYHAGRIKPDGLMAVAHHVSLLRTSRSSAGGARRNRTDDLLLAKQALSQLSYGPSGDQASVIRCQEERGAS